MKQPDLEEVEPSSLIHIYQSESNKLSYRKLSQLGDNVDKGGAVEGAWVLRRERERGNKQNFREIPFPFEIS
jgi:hypothetical protein